MAGLGPAIHDLRCCLRQSRGWPTKSGYDKGQGPPIPASIQQPVQRRVRIAHETVHLAPVRNICQHPSRDPVLVDPQPIGFGVTHENGRVGCYERLRSAVLMQIMQQAQ